jgi:hypothetical protein
VLGLIDAYGIGSRIAPSCMEDLRRDLVHAIYGTTQEEFDAEGLD